MPAEVAELINGRALPEASGLLQALYRIGNALDRERPRARRSAKGRERGCRGAGTMYAHNGHERRP